MKVLKWLLIGLGSIVVILLICGVWVYFASSGKLKKTYDVTAERITIPADQAALARGQHIVEAIAKCVDCHRPNLGGGVFIDAPPFARLWAPNLTSGRGGVGAQMSDADWIRAIRHGVLRGGRGAIIMPAEAYVHLTDADLGAVIAYVKSMPPVDTSWPAPQIGPVARVLLAANKLPIIPAAYIDHTRNGMASPEPDTTIAYGRYLAETGGCSSCHNASYSGGAAPGTQRGSPPPWNLTPTGLAGWTEANFFTALREGKKPDGSPIDNNFMPWQSSGKMTDAEIHAVWLFLQSLPPKEMGQL